MKVTYTHNRFEIDGVKIINPELLLLGSVQLNFDVKKWAELKDGESFPLPDNIIAEKMDRCKVCGAFENENCKGSYYGCDVSNVTVYRLKLKEPLVEEKAMKVKCNCPCHKNKAYKHVIQCCEDGYIEFPKFPKEQSPLVDTGSKETQEELFDELREKVYKSQWFAGDLFNYLRANYIITRK